MVHESYRNIVQWQIVLFMVSGKTSLVVCLVAFVLNPEKGVPRIHEPYAPLKDASTFLGAHSSGWQGGIITAQTSDTTKQFIIDITFTVRTCC